MATPGGARVGTAGTNYGNRSDMNAAPKQPIRAVPNQEYGKVGQQEAAQQAVPLPDFAAPTARPNEPITSGMPTGPGPTPQQAGIPQAPSNDVSVADQLRAIYSVYPSSDLADLIAGLTGQ